MMARAAVSPRLDGFGLGRSDSAPSTAAAGGAAVLQHRRPGIKSEGRGSARQQANGNTTPAWPGTQKASCGLASWVVGVWM
jgi:hypothetical protein